VPPSGDRGLTLLDLGENNIITFPNIRNEPKSLLIIKIFCLIQLQYNVKITGNKYFLEVFKKLKKGKQILSLSIISVFLTVSCSGVVDRAGKEGYDAPVKHSVVINTPEQYKPPATEVISFSDNNVEIKLFARSFAQGEAVYVEVTPAKDSVYSAELFIQGENVPLTRFSWGYRGFYGISPSFRASVLKALLFYRKDKESEVNKITGSLKVSKTDFPKAQIKVDLGKFSDKSYYRDPAHKKHIEGSRKLRAKAFKSVTRDSIRNVISHPRDFHKITSEFWKGREYLSYRIKKGKKRQVSTRKRIHRGLDLKGGAGEPVYAMADGKVVLSHDMFYEGKMVLIDHGNKIFSCYMHMSERKVQAGDRVKSGQLIGAVGSTGMSTAPHLHVSFIIRGVHVNPLSILSLPVSN
jgi:murein DD-endopeptidase MepM/ murein hydrolase activator NlpD